MITSRSWNTHIMFILVLRSLHTESKIFARKKINTTSCCQSHLHTASETFIRHKKKSNWDSFSLFFTSVASILWGVFINGVWQVDLAAQSTVWETVQDRKRPNINVESLGIIAQLFDKKLALSFLATQSQDWMDPIFLLYFSLKNIIKNREEILGPSKRKRTAKSSSRLVLSFFSPQGIN